MEPDDRRHTQTDRDTDRETEREREGDANKQTVFVYTDASVIGLDTSSRITSAAVVRAVQIDSFIRAPVLCLFYCIEYSVIRLFD